MIKKSFPAVHIIFLIRLTMSRDMPGPIDGLPVFLNRMQTKSKENQKPKL